MNSGVSFGIELPSWWGWLALVGLGWLILIEKGRRVGLLFVLVGGALNMRERLIYGGVTDNLTLLGFLNNNLADYLIAAGLIIYAWQVVLKRGSVE